MDWFVAKLVFEIKNQENAYPQFDEQLRLIEAINADLALEMAHQMGLMHQDEILNSNKNSVVWKFVAVTEIENIGEIAHGKEIHYRITEPEQADQYLGLVHAKATQLKNRKFNY